MTCRVSAASYLPLHAVKPLISVEVHCAVPATWPTEHITSVCSRIKQCYCVSIHMQESLQHDSCCCEVASCCVVVTQTVQCLALLHIADAFLQTSQHWPDLTRSGCTTLYVSSVTEGNHWPAGLDFSFLSEGNHWPEFSSNSLSFNL